jgi:hypothetical protein
MRRNREARLSGKPECHSSVRTLAGMFIKVAPEENKEEPIPEKLEEAT